MQAIPRAQSTGVFAGLIVVHLMLTGCGAGYIPFLSSGSSGGGGGGNNTASSSFPGIRNEALTGVRSSPAQLAFVLESLGSPNVGTADVTARWRLDGQGDFRPIVLDGAPAEYTHTQDGVRYDTSWDFAAVFGDDALRRALQIELTATERGGLGRSTTTLIDVPTFGNDAPVLRTDASGRLDLTQSPPGADGQYDGPIDFVVALSDTSADLAELEVEFARADDRLFAPATVSSPLDLEQLELLPRFQDAPLTWDVDADLAGFEGDAVVRFRGRDRWDKSQWYESDPFSIDVNAPPTLSIDEDAIVANADRRGVVAVPVTIVDREGDVATLALQYAKDGAFPDLPATAPEIQDVLRDPSLWDEFQIVPRAGRPFDAWIAPRPTATDDITRVATEHRAPNGEASLVGATVAFRRPAGSLAPSDLGLSTLAAAFPEPDGSLLAVTDTALIRVADGDSTTLVTDLWTHVIDAARWNDHLLLLVDDGGSWRVLAASPRDGTVQEWANESGQRPAALAVSPVGLAYVTQGSRLLAVRPDGSVTIVWTLAAGDENDRLHGVATDRAWLRHVIVAASGPQPSTDAVLLIDLDTAEERQVVALQPNGDDAFVGARRIALSPDGTTLFASTADGGDVQVRAVRLRGDAFDPACDVPSSESRAVELVNGRTDHPRTLIAGAEQTLAAVFDGDAWLAGGVEATRTVVAADAGSGRLTLDRPVPARSETQRVRLRQGTERVTGSATGRRHVITWNTTTSVHADARASRLRITVLDDSDLDDDGQVTMAQDVEFDLAPVRRALSVNHLVLQPQDVAIGDFDGDGAPDFVVANSEACEDHKFGFATLYTQQSPGVFDCPIALDADELLCSPRSCSAADLDGDGRLDIALASRGNDSVVLLRQTSPGDFVTDVLMDDHLRRPLRVETADVDHDGLPDLLVGAAGDGATPGRVAVYVHATAETFDPSPILLEPSGITPRRLAAADVDGDGLMDVVATDDAGPVWWFRRNGGATFDTGVDLAPAGILKPAGLVARDLDGNGYVDLAVTDESTNTLFVRFQSSASVFDDPALELTAPAMDGPRDLVALDMNGDGRTDLACTNNRSNNVTLFVQDDAGSFRATPWEFTSPRPPDAGADHWALAAGDLNGDGRDDLLVTQDDPDDFDDRILQFVQDRTATFSWTTDTCEADGACTPLGDGFEPGALALGDLDDDDDLDALVPGVDGVKILHQVRPGAFEVTDISLPGLLPRAARLADVLPGGGLEWILADGSRDEVTVHDADGSLRLTLDDPAMAEPLAIAVADLNADGRLDVMVAERDTDAAATEQDVFVFLQSSPGTFDPALRFALDADTRPRSLEVGDLNGDAYPDFVLTDWKTDRSTVILLETEPPGSGSLFQMTVFADDDFAGSTAAQIGDVTGDGLADVVIASRRNDALIVLSAPTWERSFWSTPLADTPRWVGLADLDGGGLLDLAGVFEDGASGAQWTVFEGLAASRTGFDDRPRLRSPPAFVTPPSSSGSVDAGLIFADIADIDGDGTFDLVLVGDDGSTPTGSPILSVRYGGR